jgi:L-asparaginase
LFVQVATAQKKPNVTILATGGTIAGAAASEYNPCSDDRCNARGCPGDSSTSRIVKGEQISTVGSQDMSFDVMHKLPNRINELGKNSDGNGIVVHAWNRHDGGDRVFLNLAAKTDKPIVMVGSIRPSTAVNVGGPLKLYPSSGCSRFGIGVVAVIGLAIFVFVFALPPGER